MRRVVRRAALAIGLSCVTGCTAPPPPAPPPVAPAPLPRPLPPTDPERTQRAREVYLGGLTLLQRSPPELEAASRELRRALELDPRFYRAHFKLGICYYHQGLYGLEIEEYRQCLAINPAYVPAWLNLGHAHLAQDQLDEARRAYREVLDREPNHPVARRNLELVEHDLRSRN